MIDQMETLLDQLAGPGFSPSFEFLAPPPPPPIGGSGAVLPPPLPPRIGNEPLPDGTPPPPDDLPQSASSRTINAGKLLFLASPLLNHLSEKIKQMRVIVSLE